VCLALRSLLVLGFGGAAPGSAATHAQVHGLQRDGRGLWGWAGTDERDEAPSLDQSRPQHALSGVQVKLAIAAAGAAAGAAGAAAAAGAGGAGAGAAGAAGAAVGGGGAAAVGTDAGAAVVGGGAAAVGTDAVGAMGIASRGYTRDSCCLQERAGLKEGRLRHRSFGPC